MKKFLLLCLIFYSGVLTAQNYNPINPLRDAWFEYNETNMGYGLRILPLSMDSVRITGVDTTYYNYKILGINNVTAYCIDQQDTNFFIDEMIVQPNGNHLFFNRFNDTILLKPFSGINSSWILYSYSNGDHIKATVTSIIQQPIFGNPDSVKVISLQALDVGNNPIVNIFNGLEIRIGKNNGFIQFYNTFEFPSDATAYNLLGKSNPDEGITNLTAAKIYNWNIGDIFQYRGGYNANMNGSMHEYEQFIILSKVISGNADTIVYNKDHIYYSKTYQFIPNLDSTIQYIHDTVIQTIIVSAYDPLNTFSYKYIDSLNYFGCGYLYQHNDQPFQYPYIGRMKKTVDPYFWSQPFDSCAYGSLATCSHFFTYAEGIGFVYDQSIPSMGCSEKYLVYYQKGSEIWGTPLDWLAITSVNSITAGNNNLTIYPNPSSGIFTISSSAMISKIEIFNLLGEQIENWNYEITNGQMDLSSQSKGVYFVKVLDVEGNYSVKKIIIE